MKYLVKVGSLKFEDGDFSKGDTIDVSAERAALFDQNDIEAINEAPVIEAPIITEAIVEAKPLPKATKKAKAVTSNAPVPE
jgi:hypothetical protein